MPIRTLPPLSLGLLALLRVLPAIAQEPGPPAGASTNLASDTDPRFDSGVHYPFGIKNGPDLHRTVVAPDPRDLLWTAAEKLDLPGRPLRLERPWDAGPPNDPSKPHGITGNTTLLGALPGAVLQGRTTEEAFHDANRKLQESEALCARNKREAAEAVRQEANRIFRAIRQEQPEWQPDRIAKLIAETGGSRDRPEVSGADRNPPHPSPSDHGNREVRELRRQLQQAEQALHESRRREEALRTVVRDLINQMDAPEPAPSGPLPPRRVPARPLPPPQSPAGPPPPPPVR